MDWVESYLRERLEHDAQLTCFRGRMASVAGHESRNGVTREEAVYGFAPESSGAPTAQRSDDFDVLICTDVLAEGMNLQQCRNIINFDLPWNPMRLVQRHGRIDRIGSKHTKVFMRTFFPDRQLDRLLKLEQRVRRKLAQAARSVGVEEAPIESGVEGQQSFAETREEIERLHHGDATLFEQGGTASAAQTGEEYRQELRQAMMQRGDEIRNLPWKAGSGMVKGTQRGHFFCVRVGDRPYLRFVPFDTPQAIEGEIGTCLRMIECQASTPLSMPLDLKQTAMSAWQAVRQDVFDSWSRETDPANLQPRVSKFNRRIAEFIRNNPPLGVEQARIERVLDAIECPCSRRDELLLRQAFDQPHESDEAKAKAVLEEVERLGLEPPQVAIPLPPIEIDDVHLVCWMAVESNTVNR